MTYSKKWLVIPQEIMSSNAMINGQTRSLAGLPKIQLIWNVAYKPVPVAQGGGSGWTHTTS